MAKACSPCNYYTQNAEESVCPTCGVAFIKIHFMDGLVVSKSQRGLD
jgi:RNA polymerase subunit RPABC4/transcription elongation factor Spt4